ncbi:MAG: ATP-dependent helicase [Acidimicrobiia bacterium]|nr:ATP-dependent helicase [Acidimicrobiia bacterium]
MNPVPVPEQLAVVEYPLAPLRVAAGAGTGKTATIAMRIVRLVTELGIEPESILSITFTNKAAAELADRIRAALGTRVEGGREIEVHTYHGFAHQILREYGALVGVERATQVITPTFSRQLIEVVMAGVDLPSLNPANRANVDDIRSLGSALGDNLLVPDDIAVPDPAPHKAWESRTSLLKALRAYQHEKTRRGVVDYADLILAAHRLVESYPEVAGEIRSRYQAVMLDEYQDTNPAQRELLRKLFGNGFPITAVGDVDQTIYEWRGASSHNFIHFPSHFRTTAGEEAASLPLTLNRRSLPVVVEVANAVRSRTGSEQQLLRPLDANIGGEVAVSWHADAVLEAQEIARKIEELSTQYQWKQMAVLFRKNKDMTLVHDALRAAGIPVEVANLGGLLAVPEVADLHAWLRLLHDPEDTPALFRILFGARYRLGMGDLVHLTRWAKAQNRSQIADEDVELPLNTLLEATDHVDELADLRSPARAALGTFREEYRRLLVDAQGVSLVELCRRVLDATGAWNDLAAMPASSQLSARLNLYRFLDLAEDWSPLEGAPSLQAFLSHLGAMAEEKAEELDTARLSGEDAVTLVTVHRAKGLEWDVVFLPAVYQKNFPAGSMGFDNPFTKGRVLPYEYRLDREWLPAIDSQLSDDENNDLLREQHERQEWRIAYVATTRAKERLFVSGASWYGRTETNRRPSLPSELWEVIANHPATRVDSRPPPRHPPQPTVLRFEHEGPAPDPLFADGWEAAVRAEIESPGTAEETAVDHELFGVRKQEFQQMLFDLPAPLDPLAEETPTSSVTGLVTFASCPLRYHWSEVDRLPRISSAAARRGSLVHRAIELHNRGQVPLEDLETSDTDPLDAYEGTSSWNGFQKSRFAEVAPAMIEQPFQMRWDGLDIRGRIDAIYGDDDWEIVDFKTGSESPDPAVRAASLVQLQAYAIAASEGHLGRHPTGTIAVTFAYLGANGSEVTYQADGEWLAAALERIDEIVSGINRGANQPTPSLACHGCDFLHVCPTGQRYVGG